MSDRLNRFHTVVAFSALHWRAGHAEKRPNVDVIVGGLGGVHLLNGFISGVGGRNAFLLAGEGGQGSDRIRAPASLGYDEASRQQPQCPNSGVHSLIPTAAGLGQAVLIDRLADPVRRHTAPDLFAGHRSAVRIAQDALLHRDGGASGQEQGAEYRGYGFHAPFLARPHTAQHAVQLKRQRNNRLSDIALFVRQHILAQRSRHGH